jgi:hypothetical protein
MYNTGHSGKSQGRIYSCGSPGEIKMWRPLLVTTNVGCDKYFLFVFISYNN